jgi:FdhD protein
MANQSREFLIEKSDGVSRTQRADVVAVEEPLEIQLTSETARGAAAKSVSVTMRTPGHDEALALGFLFTEGIIASCTQVAGVSAVGAIDDATGLQNRIRITVKPDADIDLSRLERHFYTTSSCGVCGKATLDALYVNGCASLTDEKTAFTSAILLEIPGRIRREQAVFETTGGLHGAAVFRPDGELVSVHEDVGRHNAVDKVVGELFLGDRLPGHGCGLFVSGRAGFELVQKALVAGIPLLAAVGAPSSLAVETATEFGMTLVGFLRDGGYNIYAGGERID